MSDLSEQQMIPGQVPVLVNHTFGLTIEDLSVNRNRASSVATGFAGNYAKRKGVYQFTFDFSMPPLVVGYEIPLAVLAEPFTLTYRLGAIEYSLTGAEVNSDALAIAMQAGNTTTKFSGNALNRTP